MIAPIPGAPKAASASPRGFAKRKSGIRAFARPLSIRSRNSADIIILNNRLEALLDAREVSRWSYRKMVQNVCLAVMFNGIGVPLAATGLVYPIWAMAAMALSVTAIFFNSLWGPARNVLPGRSERWPGGGGAPTDRSLTAVCGYATAALRLHRRAGH